MLAKNLDECISGRKDYASCWSALGSETGYSEAEDGCVSSAAALTLEMVAYCCLFVTQFVVFGIFVLLPVVQATYYSLYNWSGLGPLQNFIGLQNYVVLLEDSVFINAIKTNLTDCSVIARFSVAPGTFPRTVCETTGSWIYVFPYCIFPALYII